MNRFEFAQVEEIYYEPLSVLHGLDDKPGQLWEFLRFMQSASTEQKSIYIQRKEAESTFQLVSMNPELRWSSAISSNSSTNINTIHEQDDDAPHELKRLESRFLKKRARRISSTEHEEEEDVTIIDLANESLDDLGITNGNATETQSNPTTAASSTSLASSSQSLLLEKQSCISENSFQRQVGKIDSDQDTNLSFKSTPSSISEDDDSFRSLRRAAIVVPGSKESSQSKKSQARPTRHSLFTSRRAWTFMSLNIPCPTQECVSFLSTSFFLKKNNLSFLFLPFTSFFPSFSFIYFTFFASISISISVPVSVFLFIILLLLCVGTGELIERGTLITIPLNVIDRATCSPFYPIFSSLLLQHLIF